MCDFKDALDESITGEVQAEEYSLDPSSLFHHFLQILRFEQGHPRQVLGKDPVGSV